MVTEINVGVQISEDVLMPEYVLPAKVSVNTENGHNLIEMATDLEKLGVTDDSNFEQQITMKEEFYKEQLALVYRFCRPGHVNKAKEVLVQILERWKSKVTAEIAGEENTKKPNFVLRVGLKLDNKMAVCSIDTLSRSHLLSWFILFFELGNCETSKETPPYCKKASAKISQVTQTLVSQLKWLNSHLTKIWPYVNEAASELIKASVESILEQDTPIILSSIKFSKLTLGTVAPQFTGVYVIKGRGDSVTLELEMQWDGNPSIILAINTLLGVSLPVQVKDIGFTGVFRLIFKPLVDQFPCFGVVSFSLREKKIFDFKLKVVGGDISAIPGLQDRMKKSRTINNDLSPIWNEHFEFVVEDESTQHLVVKIFDDEGLGASELIGCAQVQLSELQPGKVKDVWLKLVKSLEVQGDNKNRGQVHLELLYVPDGMDNGFVNSFTPNFSMTALEKVLKSGANGIDATENEKEASFSFGKDYMGRCILAPDQFVKALCSTANSKAMMELYVGLYTNIGFHDFAINSQSPTLGFELLFAKMKLIKVLCKNMLCKILTQVDPKDIIALGATTQGHMLHDRVIDFSSQLNQANSCTPLSNYGHGTCLWMEALDLIARERKLSAKNPGSFMEMIFDKIMGLFLRVLVCRSATVHEEVMLAIGALAHATGPEFAKYMPKFYKYLKMVLKIFEKYQIGVVAVGIAGNIVRALEDKILPYCDGIMIQLLKAYSPSSIVNVDTVKLFDHLEDKAYVLCATQITNLEEKVDLFPYFLDWGITLTVFYFECRDKMFLLLAISAVLNPHMPKITSGDLDDEAWTNFQRHFRA